MVDEAHVTTIASHPELRGHGVGERVGGAWTEANLRRQLGALGKGAHDVDERPWVGESHDGDDAGIAAELALPEGVAQDEQIGSAFPAAT